MSYNPKFITNTNVSLPQLPESEILKFKNSGRVLKNYSLDYKNYSVLHNPFRRLPYYSATNIDGSLFVKLDRVGTWSNEDELSDKEQFDEDLYKALNKVNNPSNKKCKHRVNCPIDRGHMTKREDVQWSKGKDKEKAEEAAKSTFVYTNAAPQHYRLNQTIWRYIEDYILHKETVLNDLKICVFTGPVLSEDDPYSIVEIDSQKVQLPVLFWKIVYYPKPNKELCRTAFLTNQHYLLQRDNVIPRVKKSKTQITQKKIRNKYFTKFKYSETFQVQVSLIEELTNYTFSKACENFIDKRPKLLVLNNVKVRSDKVFTESNKFKTIKIQNLTL